MHPRLLRRSRLDYVTTNGGVELGPKICRWHPAPGDSFIFLSTEQTEEKNIGIKSKSKLFLFSFQRNILPGVENGPVCGFAAQTSCTKAAERPLTWGILKIETLMETLTNQSDKLRFGKLIPATRRKCCRRASKATDNNNKKRANTVCMNFYRKGNTTTKRRAEKKWSTILHRYISALDSILIEMFHIKDARYSACTRCCRLRGEGNGWKGAKWPTTKQLARGSRGSIWLESSFAQVSSSFSPVPSVCAGPKVHNLCYLAAKLAPLAVTIASINLMNHTAGLGPREYTTFWSR